MRVLRALPLVLLACLGGGESRALDLTRDLSQFQHSAWTIRDGLPAYTGAIAQTPDGYLWIGAPSGLYRFDGLQLQRFEQRLSGDAVQVLATSRSGDLWIGTSGGVSRLSQGVVTNFNVEGMDGPAGVQHIAIAPDGQVWIASDVVADSMGANGKSWTVTGAAPTCTASRAASGHWLSGVMASSGPRIS